MEAFRGCALGAALLLSAAFPLHATAQAWPSKNIRVVSPLAPGGPVDLLARVIAAGLQERHGQPAIVENLSGGNGVIGMDNVRRSAPDGHTMVVAPSGYVTINPTLMKSLPYSVEKDFAPVSMLAKAPNILVAHPSLGAGSVREIVALAKAKPGGLAFASPGVGSGLHLAGELFKQETGTEITHVPYKGTGPALNDVLSGHVGLMLGNLQTLLPHVRSGKLRAIGVTDTVRSPVAPDIATIAEQGPAAVVATSWYGLLVPSGTPAAVVSTLSRDVAEILNRPGTRDQFGKQGLAVWILGPAEFRDLARRETAAWAKIITARKIVAE
jgi:tripartite-type tricarboxylate transporter receptor subunit TctC